MQMSLVEQVRSFNRTVTERVGALDDHFLGRDHPLGEARLLWEIGGAGAEIQELESRLSLDSASLGRRLQALQEQGLIVVGPGGTDRSLAHVQLTAAGQRERTELEHRAAAFAQALLEPLNDHQRVKLAAAMAEVERLLVASMITIALTDPTSPDAQWCFAQYFAELNERFDAGFDPAISISASAHELTPPHGLLLVARLRQEPIGCGALKLHENAPGELKRMWVSPRSRGLGVGRRLLRELEHSAKNAGVTVLRLETNRSLTEAIELYRHSGYQEVEAFNTEPYAHHWFEKHL